MKKNVRSKKVTMVEYVICAISILILILAIKSNYSTYETVLGEISFSKVKAQAINDEYELKNNNIVEDDKVLVAEVKLTETEVNLTVGDMKYIDGSVSPENASNKLLKWESSDESVVTVSSIGKLTGIKEGTATIKVLSDEDKNVYKTLNVTVKAPVVKVEEVKVPENTTKQQTKVPENTNNTTTKKQQTQAVQSANTQQAKPAQQAKPVQTAPSTYAGSSGYDSYINEVIALVNQQRANNGVAPLTQNASINQLAKVRAEEAAQVWSHTRPDGRKWSTVFTDYGVSSSARGENIAYGQRTPQAVVDAWMNSKTHRDNLLEPKFTKITMWVYNNNGTLFWEQLFTN